MRLHAKQQQQQVARTLQRAHALPFLCAHAVIGLGWDAAVLVMHSEVCPVSVAVVCA